MKTMMTRLIRIISMGNLLRYIYILFPLIITAQKQWTLKACIDHALENNISVRQSANTLLTNDQDIILSLIHI